jgi:hypothetical protein
MLNMLFYYCCCYDYDIFIILSADADIGRGSRMRVRMRLLLCSSAQGSNNDFLRCIQTNQARAGARASSPRRRTSPSASCVSVNVDGFTSQSPSSATSRSPGLEGFATVSLELCVHTDNSHPESLQYEHVHDFK